MTSLLFFCAIGSWATMTLLWWRQRSTKNANAVDAIWAVGIGIETALLAWISDGNIYRRVFITTLVSIWAVRLAGHLFFDRVLNEKEDGRYTRFRQEWSPWGFYGLFLVQGLLVFLLPLTFLSALNNSNSFPTILDLISLVIWVGAITGETIADRQLAVFRSNPTNKGRTCRNGLWKYSRHPNYFFEWVMWCAYIPIALGSNYFWVSLLGPTVLLVLLLFVSGVPPTEAQALSSRGEDYRHYQATTSVFIPWFPKRNPL